MRIRNVLLVILPLFFAGKAAGQFQLPPQDFWHFAVRSAEKTAIMVIFPSDWTSPSGASKFAEQQFQVQRSDSPAFSSPTTVPGPFLSSGATWVALDGVSNGTAMPYYRVQLTDTQGGVIATSPVAQPFEQAGNFFVVNQATVIPGIPCGDISLSPCPDVNSALAIAPTGATIYIAPGIYSGPGNVDLTFAGKALTVQSTNGPSLTMINGTDPTTGNASRIFSLQNNEGRDAVITGLTLANGAADTGGCISLTGASPTISNCIFLQCNATTGVSLGGAIYAFGNPAPGPLVQDSQFIYNWGVEGAAIYVGGASAITVTGCFFDWGVCPTATGRGGALCVVLGNATVSNCSMQNSIVGFGGGGIMLERAAADVTNITAYNNTAGNFGGAFLLFGAEMRISNSNVTGNRGSIFAGGVIITSAVYEATNVIHNDNWGRVGGGAIKVVGGQAHLTQCEIRGNSAGYGAGFDIAKQTDVSTMYTQVIVEESLVADNAVPQSGAAFYLDSFDALTFRNVIFRNNTATKGGAGYCVSPVPAILSNVTFEGNVAQSGGGLFADAPCQMSLDGVVFRQNTAVDAGAGIATGDGAVLNITQSIFDSNGMSDCLMNKPPTTGGAMMIGVQEFQINRQCGNPSAAVLTKVSISNSSIVSNLATSYGGGIAVQSGMLVLEGVDVNGNQVVGGIDGSQGVGGGIALYELCQPGAPCTTAIAQLTDTSIVNNTALAAGGGLHFVGGSSGGSLTVAQMTISGNSVAANASDGYGSSQDGVGGGAFLGRANFSLDTVELNDNIAYYGGGLFISADLSLAGAKFSHISATNNRAVLGPAVYWLVSASPNSPLPQAAFSVTPANGNASFATEVLHASYATQPPTSVQSAADISTFSINLLDFYNNVGISELGSCSVAGPTLQAYGIGNGKSSNSNNDTVTIRPQGSEVGVSQGAAVFSQLAVTGTIGQSYNLSVECTPNSLGRSKYLNLTGQALPPLVFPVSLSPCASGNEPKNTGSGSVCVECPFNSFNYDGQSCKPCPEGAVCPGGDQLSSKQDWWRSSSTSTQFYGCRTPNICEAGTPAGDAACVQGNSGPLCAVCLPNWFAFAGQCKECNQSGQAKIMLAVTVILIVVVVGVLFVWSFEFGDPTQPGFMTKIKILLSHFQILALFRDYDVLWPTQTSTGFGWFDTFNISFSMMAPACFMGSSYSFYTKWVFEMLMPLGAVGLCIVVYFGARWLLVWANLHKEDTPAGGQEAGHGGDAHVLISSHGAPITENRSHGPGKWSRWLDALKIRCFKNAFWFVTLLYPRSSMTALQMFGRQTLDTGTYLTADFSIMVKPPGGSFTEKYVHYMIPGAIMLFIFAVVVPAVWFWMIWRHRRNLEDPVVGSKYGFLYGSYTRKCCYWETVDALRKFAFAFVPVFIKTNSAGSVQGTVGEIISAGYLVLTVWVRPFARLEDNILQIASECVLFLVLVSGCTAKWAGLGSGGLKGLAVAQLFSTSAVAFAILATTVLSITHWIRKAREHRRSSASSLGDKPDEGKRRSDASGSLKTRMASLINIAARAGSRPSEPKILPARNAAGEGGGAVTFVLEEPLGTDREERRSSAKKRRDTPIYTNLQKMTTRRNPASGTEGQPRVHEDPPLPPA